MTPEPEKITTWVRREGGRFGMEEDTVEQMATEIEELDPTIGLLTKLEQTARDRDATVTITRTDTGQWRAEMQWPTSPGCPWLMAEPALGSGSTLVEALTGLLENANGP